MAYARLIEWDDLWAGEMASFTLNGRGLVVVKLGERVYAYEDRCAHQGVALSAGRLDGHVLTCSAHEWQYDIRSGCGINPESACLRSYPVKVEQGVVWVDVGDERE